MKKRLILRLSSLGDVVLATSALEVFSKNAELVDWVVAKEYAALLQGHPQVFKLWEFDRETGIKGWLDLSKKLWRENYDEVFDLHASIRTKITYFFFFFLGLFRVGRQTPKWKFISKQRARFSGYFLLKKFWPRVWRPSPRVELFAKLAGGNGKERPNLRNLLRSEKRVSTELSNEKYICVMPSSNWRSKNWPVENFLNVLKKIPAFPVVLGSSKDLASGQLAAALDHSEMPYFNGVGKWDLGEIAGVLSGSIGYFGNDTGLAHLAEAVGVPSFVIFGPTVPDMGFGPWRSESRALESLLGCRPCGKDGRYCTRFSQRYLCLKGLTPKQVSKTLVQELKMEIIR